jgi:PTS system fructose-specific IIC component
MAAESLENKAKALGVNIKVETDGSGGAKNVLTEEDIAKADCVIIAADKNVEMARFNGKKVIKTKVADGIHKADALIKDAMAGKGSVFYAEGGSEKSEKTTGGDSIGHTIYKHLMSGVSHMLPFVIGGGILISLAFLFDNYEIDPSNFGSNTPLAAFLKTIGGTAFGFMLPILSGFIAMSIAERPGLAIGFVGGAIANAGVTFTNPSGGISAGFLGALIAGFAAGYLVVGLRKLFSKLPKSLEGIKPILLYPVLGLLFIGIIVAFINPGVAAINTAMNDALASMSGTSKVLLGVVLGGMMSIDMGGPFNKAAYVFGTAGLASGEFEIMAAVMAGGMVPPLAIALSATFFRNRYKKSERESALVNYIMGLSFITEGAIPFAAADPIRVLPSCIIGSSIAGGLSVLFGCGLRAPHGGLFVVPVVSNPFGYLAAIAIGAVVGALLLGVLKKPVEE